MRIDDEFLERRTAHDSRAHHREAPESGGIQPCLAPRREAAEEGGVMYPVVTGTPPARLPAASRVDKATSHLLQGPDWAVNLEIYDTLNADRW